MWLAHSTFIMKLVFTIESISFLDWPQAEHFQLNSTKVTVHELMQIELCKANFLEGYLEFLESFLERILTKHLNALWLHISKWL